MNISKRKMKANIIKFLKECMFERDYHIDELKELIKDFLDYGGSEEHSVDVNRFGRDDKGILVTVTVEGKNNYFYCFGSEENE